MLKELTRALKPRGPLQRPAAAAVRRARHIVTTADELFKHIESGGGDQATKEALRYPSALFAGVRSIRTRPLTATTAVRIFSELPGREMTVRAMPGVTTVADRCVVSRQTASSWLRALVGAGLLTDVKVGRDLLFVNDELLNVLTRPE